MERHMQWLSHGQILRMPTWILFGHLRKLNQAQVERRSKKDMSSMKVYTCWYEGAHKRKRCTINKLVDQCVGSEEASRNQSASVY